MSFRGMRRSTKIALLSIALAASLVTALAATTAPAVLHYATAITEIYGPTTPQVGTLDLQIGDGGILYGYYHTDGVRSFDPVTGGRDGDHIWFDIGHAGLSHVTGLISPDGTISGQEWNDDGDRLYRFTATLIKPSVSPATATASPPDFE